MKLSRTRAHQIYTTTTGRMVPGVTTILNCLDDGSSGALIHWAWKMGMEQKDYRKVRDQAADVGTIAHFMIENYLNKTKRIDLSEYSQRDIDLAKECADKFKEFWVREKFKLFKAELQLVSDDHLYGGTLDILVRSPKGLALIDLKTSKGIYDKYWYQLSAYKQLALENLNPNLKVTRCMIVRIGKEDGSFEVQEKLDLSRHWNVFRSLIPTYYHLQSMKE